LVASVDHGLHARLFDGQSVETDIATLLYNLTYDGLLDSNPPAGFQIDGNFGVCAGIAESLLQSHNDLVNILPALIPSSSSGSFTGLAARGGFVVGASWSNSELVNVTILSRLGNSLNVTVGTGQSITAEGAQTAEGFAEWISMNTTAGKT
jgi:alpha-L-fucosidase 2